MHTTSVGKSGPRQLFLHDRMQPDETCVVMQGQAQIKCNTLGRWRRRWCVLRASHLFDVYTHELSDHLTHQRTVLSCVDCGGNDIKLVCGNGDRFRLRFQDLEEKRIWWSAAQFLIVDPPNGDRVQHVPVCGSDFRVIRLVGKGAFGSVYKVKRAKTSLSPTCNAHSYYAMKIIAKGKSTKSALVERQMAERARHPFIIQLRYSYQSSRNFYLISDFYGGGSLQYHLCRSKKGFFAENVVKFWGAEILLALEHLHFVGILYRDLKLENVLLDSDGHVGITDFGLSTEHSDVKLGGKAGEDCSRRFGGKHVGTPFYLAPEVLTNSSISHTVDLWALGVLLHELMVGNTPFTGSNRQQLFAAIVKQPLNLQWNLTKSGKDPSQRLGFRRTLSDGATFVLEGLLEKDPRKRLRASDLKCTPFFAKFFKTSEGSLHGLDDVICLMKSTSPPYKPVHYNSEVNVKKNLNSIFSGDKKTLSSTCCGGPKYIPGFYFVRTSSKTNLNEEKDSHHENIQSAAVRKKLGKPWQQRPFRISKNLKCINLDHDLLGLRRTSSEGAKSMKHLQRSNSLSSVSPKHFASLGWDAVHSIF